MHNYRSTTGNRRVISSPRAPILIFPAPPRNDSTELLPVRFPHPVADIPRDSPSGNSRDKANVACNCSLRDKRSLGIRLERNLKLRERCRVLCIDIKLGGSEGYPLGVFPSEPCMAESILV